VEKTADKDAVVLTYGVFLQTIFDFVIIAFAIFLSMKLINRLKRSIVKEEKAEEAQEEVAEPSEDVKLLTEIRDLLKQQNSGK
jgi:large conductance mechanosensitive channel